MQEGEKNKKSGIRWIVLFLSCFTMFGNFYAFDNPAALNKQLGTWLGSSPETFNFQLNLLYSIYSLPNTILPFFSGYLLQHFNNDIFFFLFSLLVCVGQVVFCLGVQSRHFPLMIAGRLIFGFGSESLGVSQTNLMTLWFRGRELSLAVGLTMSIARIGAVTNNIVSPTVAEYQSVPTACWIGAFMCFMSFGSTIYSVFLNRKHQHAMKPKSPENDKLKGFNKSFWILGTVCFLFCASIGPFNAISGTILQERYSYNGIEAGMAMSIPDLFAIFFVPFVGMYLDYRGYRGIAMIICGILLVSVHLTLAYLHVPILSLALLGLAIPLTLGCWSCVPLLVSKQKISTAYGLLYCFTNTSLVLTPILVAYFLKFDPSYFYVEILFVFLSVCGTLLALLINFTDYRFKFGLNFAEKQASQFVLLEDSKQIRQKIIQSTKESSKSEEEPKNFPPIDRAKNVRMASTHKRLIREIAETLPHDSHNRPKKEFMR